MVAKREVGRWPIIGPLARRFKDSTPEQIAEAKEAIAEALKPYATPDGVKLAGACWLVRARQS